MAWFGRDRGYDRTRILGAARRASGRGAHTKAIALYERVQEVEPRNADVLRRLSVVRARAGHREEAWRDCRAACRIFSMLGVGAFTA